MAIATFKTDHDLSSSLNTPFLFNEPATLDHLKLLLFETHYLTYLWNTFLVGAAVVVITLAMAVPAAYSLARGAASCVQSQAVVAGLSRLGRRFRLVSSLSISGLLTIVVFAFTLTMHEFIYALTFISVSVKKTVSIGVPTELVRGDVFQWGPLMAGALIASIPVAVVYTFFLDRFIAGFTMGAVK